ncbi:MAG: ABC transporter ATP-binding protein [Armatimonadota bacterium]
MATYEATGTVQVAELVVPPAVQTYGLSKHYGRITAVRDLSLTIPRGTIYGLLGPNGAGKTTTMRMLLGLVRPTAGSATVLGMDCRHIEARAPGNVGAFVDGMAFYPYLSGRRNLHLLCHLSGSGHDEVEGALESVGLTANANRLVRAYSHGMRQRLGIAAALVPRPRLLVLDEPASGLDPAGVRDIRDLLRRLSAEDMTILLSSHLLWEVQQLCTHVGIMFSGCLVAHGTVDELLAENTLGLTVVVDRPDRALELLEEQGHRVTRGSNGSLFVTVSQDQVPDINALLVNGGLRVYTLSPHHKTLEDLYMEFVERGRYAASS